jgi:acyl-CoA reductase-like NAD-dependent aldehyde dehydrogenase
MMQYDPFGAQLFIGTEYVSSHQNVRDVINPSTLQPCGRIADATPAEIDRVLACAEALAPLGRSSTPRRERSSFTPLRNPLRQRTSTRSPA